MLLFPNGDSEEYEGNVSLFLVCNELSAINSTAKAIFKIISESGKTLLKHKLAQQKEEEYQEGSGLVEFISHEQLFAPSSNFISADNKLRIECKVRLCNN